jgi:hypothetical protein
MLAFSSPVCQGMLPLVGEMPTLSESPCIDLLGLVTRRTSVSLQYIVCIDGKISFLVHFNFSVSNALGKHSKPSGCLLNSHLKTALSFLRRLTEGLNSKNVRKSSLAILRLPPIMPVARRSVGPPQAPVRLITALRWRFWAAQYGRISTTREID